MTAKEKDRNYDAFLNRCDASFGYGDTEFDMAREFFRAMGAAREKRGLLFPTKPGPEGTTVKLWAIPKLAGLPRGAETILEDYGYHVAGEPHEDATSFPFFAALGAFYFCQDRESREATTKSFPRLLRASETLIEEIAEELEDSEMNIAECVIWMFHDRSTVLSDAIAKKVSKLSEEKKGRIVEILKIVPREKRTDSADEKAKTQTVFSNLKNEAPVMKFARRKKAKLSLVSNAAGSADAIENVASSFFRRLLVDAMTGEEFWLVRDESGEVEKEAPPPRDTI